MASVAPVVMMTSVCRVRGQSVEPLLVGRDCLPQFRDALARRVLVGPGGDGGLGGCLDFRGAVLIREPLAEVDGAGLDGQGGHLFEDRDAQCLRRGPGGWLRGLHAATEQGARWAWKVPVVDASSHGIPAFPMR